MWIDAASKFAGEVDFLMNVIHVVTIIPFVLVNAVLVYFVIKYRRRGEKDNITSNVAHNTTIEVVWTLVPTVVMLWLCFWGLALFNDMRGASLKKGDPLMQIDVRAMKWNWDFIYRPDVRQVRTGKNADKALKSGVLFLEENKDTKLIMRSRDVIHSFFIPAFRVKEDVVGSIYTFVYFNPLITKTQEKMTDAERKSRSYNGDVDGCLMLKEANKKLKPEQRLNLKRCGSYRIYCTEYCGKDHSNMTRWAVVLEPADFRKQLGLIEAEDNNVTAARGQGIFNRNCVSCHSADGSRKVGPTFKGLYDGTKGKLREFDFGVDSVNADENYIRESILNPRKKIVKGYPKNGMPVQNLNDSEIRSVIEYIKTLQ